MAGNGLAVLALGLILAGPTWAAAPPVSEVSRMQVEPGTLDTLGQPLFITEVEPNDTTGTAQALASTPVRVRGDLYRFPVAADVDVYSFTAAAGDRVYAATMTSFSAGGVDTVIDIIGTDGMTVLETDDDNGTFTINASNIGGTFLGTGGTYFVRVRPSINGPLGNTIRPYDLYVCVQSGAPLAETEPNNNGGTANPLPANGWMSGVINPGTDLDTFSLTANAGDTIVAILDLDPERDATVWNGNVGIGLFNNLILFTSDSGASDAIPSEAMFMTVRTTGNYFIYVIGQTAGAVGTYRLSVSVIPARTRTCTAYPGTGGAITDLATTEFTVAIPDLATIDALQLFLNATHTLPADLDVTLISPDGNEVFLFDDPPGTGTAAPQFNLTLDDEAAIPIFGVHSGMHYTPEPQGRLAYFQGMQAQGTWTLRVRDDTAVNTGTVNAWSLNVCEAAPLPACAPPGETTVFTTDFETGDAGFTHAGAQDEWARGLPTLAPITTAHSGTNAFKTDLAGTYNNNANFDLRSPGIDLTSVTGRVTLNWWQKYQMESASFDTYYVEVREVGAPANFRRLFSWTGATQTRGVGNPAVTINQSAGWGLVQADISDFAGLNTEVRFHVESDSSGQLAGVAIDDVLVTSCTTLLPSDLIFEDGFE